MHGSGDGLAGLDEAADGSFEHGDRRVCAQQDVTACADDREAGAGEGRAIPAGLPRDGSDGSTLQQRRLQTIQVTCYLHPAQSRTQAPFTPARRACHKADSSPPRLVVPERTCGEHSTRLRPRRVTGSTVFLWPRSRREKDDLPNSSHRAPVAAPGAPRSRPAGARPRTAGPKPVTSSELRQRQRGLLFIQASL